MKGERTITVVGSVNIDLVVEMDALPRAGETVLGKTFRVTPGGKGANQAVAAARHGAHTEFVGCVGDDEYGRTARRNLLDNGVDVVIPNEIEAEQLTGCADPADAARALERMGAQRAIITLGEKGVWDGELKPAFAVDGIDTVGAGDAFVGAYAAALARTVDDPVRFGQAAAARTGTRPGAQNVPSKEEVEEFLAARR